MNAPAYEQPACATSFSSELAMPLAWSTASMAAICSSGATGEREKNHNPALLTPVRQLYGSEGAA